MRRLASPIVPRRAPSPPARSLACRRRFATVMAIEPVSLLGIDRATFAYYRKSAPRLIGNLSRILAQRLRRTNEQLLALATLDVTGRVARQLLLLAEAYGQQEGDGIHIHLRLTQENLAQIVGASRERVNQALRQLKLQGILAVRDQHRLVLRDMEVLHAYL
jgi:CRP/FNR family cyclic AMP-dependent transcriptional regulator